MDVLLFKWYDELNNESDCYFLRKTDCDFYIQECRRVGYKLIGNKVNYKSFLLQLPPEGKILQNLSAWYMNNRIQEMTWIDVEDIALIWSLLSQKVRGLKTIDKSHLHNYLQSIDQFEIDRILSSVDEYLYDIFIECHIEFILTPITSQTSFDWFLHTEG